jgi:hypothetical protein
MKKPLLAALLSFCCSCASAGPPKPLLWKVSDADNEIYLLGSFHLLKPGDYPLAPQVDAAFADAETLVMELSPREMNDPALGMKMANAARLGGGVTLRQVLPPGDWARLEAYAAKRGIPLAGLESHEPWFVALIITMTEMQRFGLDPALGLDKHFADRAGAAGKPVVGLETGDQQIAVFDGMGKDEQRQALADALDDLDAMEAAIAKMHAQWRSGDGDALYREMAMEMKADYPALYQRVNADRNRSWLPRLQALLDDSKEDDTLVVVGALHLLGEDGVVEMLRAKGYRVERL